jgi:hypothetical protein
MFLDLVFELMYNLNWILRCRYPNHIGIIHGAIQILEELPQIAS